MDDEHPKNNLVERKALEEIGIVVDVTTNTEAALDFLGLYTYDVVITDLVRANDSAGACQSGVAEQAGCDLLRKMRSLLGAEMPRTYIYAARVDAELGIPPFASGITNRLDELLHSVFDALERRNIITKVGR